MLLDRLIELNEAAPYLSKGAIDMSAYRYYGIGWRYTDILPVLEYLKNNKYLILGGDTYGLKGDTCYYILGDDWYTDLNDDRDLLKNHQADIVITRKYEMTKRYLSDHHERNKQYEEHFLYTLSANTIEDYI